MLRSLVRIGGVLLFGVSVSAVYCGHVSFRASVCSFVSLLFLGFRYWLSTLVSLRIFFYIREPRLPNRRAMVLVARVLTFFNIFFCMLFGLKFHRAVWCSRISIGGWSLVSFCCVLGIRIIFGFNFSLSFGNLVVGENTVFRRYQWFTFRGVARLPPLFRELCPIVLLTHAPVKIRPFRYSWFCVCYFCHFVSHAWIAFFGVVIFWMQLSRTYTWSFCFSVI